MKLIAYFTLFFIYINSYGFQHINLIKQFEIGSNNIIFSKIESIDLDMEGNVYLLDPRAHKIFKFDRHGKLERIIGRQGNGPGEFSRYAFELFVNDEYLFLQDSTLIHKFNLKGDFLRKYITKVFFFKTFINKEFAFGIYWKKGPKRKSTAIAILDKDFNILKDIQAFPDPKAYYVKDIRGTIELHPTHYFSNKLIYNGHSNNLLFGFSNKYEIFSVDKTGKKTIFIKRDFTNKKITEKTKKMIIQKIFEEMKDFPKNIVKKSIYFPKHRPIFKKILINSKTGEIYIRKTGEYSKRDKEFIFDVFSKSGEYTNTYVFDKDPEIIFGKYLYTIDKENCLLIKYKMIQTDH
jgi:hypothetical protein